MSSPFQSKPGVNPCCVPSKERLAQWEFSRRMSGERRVAREGSVEGMIRLDGGSFWMGSED